jgi:3-methyladenine DNA glycosylase AlkD
MVPEYILPLRDAFLDAANPGEAAQMKKYMKNKFEFFGIKSPLRKDIYKQHKAKYGLLPQNGFKEIVEWCWKQEQREYQYFAMEFLKKGMKKTAGEIIDLYEFMILNKSWWDTVDFIASTLIGYYFKRFNDQIVPKTSIWMASENIWLQRSCLLFQLKYKSTTDIGLLCDFIDRLSGSNEFFINKAIGWVLREFSKTNPALVVEVVDQYSLSGLSRREALKWMLSRGLV